MLRLLKLPKVALIEKLKVLKEQRRELVKRAVGGHKVKRAGRGPGRWYRAW